MFVCVCKSETNIIGLDKYYLLTQVQVTHNMGLQMLMTLAYIDIYIYGKKNRELLFIGYKYSWKLPLTRLL